VLRRLEHSRYNFAVAPSNAKFVTNFDSMRGFDWSPVQKHKARVAKLLGQAAARAKTAYFEKNIQSHLIDSVATPNPKSILNARGRSMPGTRTSRPHPVRGAHPHIENKIFRASRSVRTGRPRSQR
jgi:hypothetical protein